jgi:hypothetical protein
MDYRDSEQLSAVKLAPGTRARLLSWIFARLFGVEAESKVREKISRVKPLPSPWPIFVSVEPISLKKRKYPDLDDLHQRLASIDRKLNDGSRTPSSRASSDPTVADESVDVYNGVLYLDNGFFFTKAVSINVTDILNDQPLLICIGNWT